jgi:uncharacterized protein YjbI with pentapeptide repeats
LVLIAGVPVALYSVYYFAESVQLLATAVLVLLLLIAIVGLIVVRNWDRIIASVLRKPVQLSQDVSEPLAKSLSLYSQGRPEDAETELKTSIEHVISHFTWVQTRRWILGASTALLLGFAGLVGSALLKQQNDLILRQNTFFREQIDQQQQQLELQQAVSNQSVRSEAFRRIYGPEFKDNPRVKAEAIRSLISVERVRIASDNNTLPTDFINLHDAGLQSTWLDSADLRKASFRGSDLQKANFNSAILSGSRLRFTEFRSATFINATLVDSAIMFSDGKASVFSDADLSEVVFTKVDLSGALLDDANLQNASFQDTNLQGADLRNVQNWKEIETIAGSNLYGVRNAPEGFVNWALERGAINEAGALSDLWKQAQAFREREEGAK